MKALAILSVLFNRIAGQAEESLRNSSIGTGIYVGSGAINWNHVTADSEFAERTAKEYALITAGNDCKMIAIAKGYDDIRYEKCQYMVEFAKNNS